MSGSSDLRLFFLISRLIDNNKFSFLFILVENASAYERSKRENSAPPGSSTTSNAESIPSTPMFS